MMGAYKKISGFYRQRKKSSTKNKKKNIYIDTFSITRQRKYVETQNTDS